jgi:hypothetical protein
MYSHRQRSETSAVSSARWRRRILSVGSSVMPTVAFMCSSREEAHYGQQTALSRAGVPHSGGKCSTRVAFIPVYPRMRDPAQRADMPTRKSKANTVLAREAANDTSRERATGIEPA